MQDQADLVKEFSIHPELTRLNQFISANLTSNLPFINLVSAYLLESGKRLRPQIVILCARATGYTGEQHLIMASVIEMIHAATLLHDDVADKSLLRHGKPSSNALWGEKSAILVGDYLYSKAFQLMLRLNIPEVLAILSSATSIIAEGEMQQLQNQFNPHLSIEDYFATIAAKTAKLFEAAAEITAFLSNTNLDYQVNLANYGKYFGLAYQIIDDALDYFDNALGKVSGEDLANGKTTLPVIYLLSKATLEDQNLVIDSITHGKRENLQIIQTQILKYNIFADIYRDAATATNNAIKAIMHLPNNSYRQAAINLANSILHKFHTKL